MGDNYNRIKEILDRKEALLVMLSNAEIRLEARKGHIARIREVANRGVLDPSVSLGFESKKEGEDTLKVSKIKDKLSSVEKELETIKISSPLNETSKLLEELIAINNSNQSEKLIEKDEFELSREWFDERYKLLFLNELKSEFVNEEIKRTKSCIEMYLSPKVNLKVSSNKEYLELAQQYLSYVSNISGVSDSDEENTTLTLREIALLYYFKGDKITIHNQDVFAERHGQENKGKKLYSEHFKRIVEDDKEIYQHRYAKKYLESIRSMFEKDPSVLSKIDLYINQCD